MKTIESKSLSRLALESKVFDMKAGQFKDVHTPPLGSCTCYSCDCDGCDRCDCVCQSNCCDCNQSANLDSYK